MSCFRGLARPAPDRAGRFGVIPTASRSLPPRPLRCWRDPRWSSAVPQAATARRWSPRRRLRTVGMAAGAGRWNEITGLSRVGRARALRKPVRRSAFAVAGFSAGVSCRSVAGWAGTDGFDRCCSNDESASVIGGSPATSGRSVGAPGPEDTGDAAEIGLPAHLKLPGRRRDECVQHRPFAGRAAATGSPPAANDRHARSGRYRHTAMSGSALFRP